MRCPLLHKAREVLVVELLEPGEDQGAAKARVDDVAHWLVRPWHQRRFDRDQGTDRRDRVGLRSWRGTKAPASSSQAHMVTFDFGSGLLAG